MTYKVEYTKEALKDLSKIDKHTRTFILAWIKKNLVDCIDPYQSGKSLTANHKGQWRYRVGDYRIITEIKHDTVTILVVTVGHRRDIYKG